MRELGVGVFLVLGFVVLLGFVFGSIGTFPGFFVVECPFMLFFKVFIDLGNEVQWVLLVIDE